MLITELIENKLIEFNSAFLAPIEFNSAFLASQSLLRHLKGVGAGISILL